MIPRPENLITKTDKLFIPVMENTDHFYVKTRNYITSII